MSNMKRTDEFFAKVNGAGLNRAFSKLSDMTSETLDCYLEDIIDDFVYDQEKPWARIQFEKKDGREFYNVELKMNEEDDWSLDSRWELKDDMIHFTALTKIRELLKQGYGVCFK